MEERKPNKKSRLTEEEQRLKERLIRREPEPGEIKHGTGRLPDEFWTMPRVEDPEGLARRYLIEDRREGR